MTFGGHFLPPNQIHRFASVCEWQLANPDSAALNEDPIKTVRMYLLLTAKHLRNKRNKKEDWAEEFGGEQIVRLFDQTLERIDPRLTRNCVLKPFSRRGSKR
ncbi:uncharacterized protein MYCGRDRAFT_97963 [Zymoseptoria tritici IPO323]|uniref:Uncharacterized protein n=1 Tax=Zymoseptoria tritici (strain CBS 115943 / IPO323) TaxID=336722 RepID=F9XRW9_ZYMTI|nr:uncharacterized protein MYCGRDRAFT_97963 [Zymoseptoria tritici IPO323]EGP81992.1 hypothetical protein MYCGRDRAFT_97963 [Zymoseptoria tritici IPO323]